MKYKQYEVSIDGVTKRLGLLAETHFYTKEESAFAREIVAQYDNIATEGASKVGIVGLISLLSAPDVLLYMFLTNRSPFNRTAKQHAKEMGKNIIHLEEDESQQYSLAQKTLSAICGLLSPLRLPYTYARLKLYGDPHKVGTKAYQRREAKRRDHRISLMGKLYHYMVNLKKRSKTMTQRSVALLSWRDIENLLIPFGTEHLDGIIENLHIHELDLQEVEVPTFQ